MIFANITADEPAEMTVQVTASEESDEKQLVATVDSSGSEQFGGTRVIPVDQTGSTAASIARQAIAQASRYAALELEEAQPIKMASMCW